MPRTTLTLEPDAMALAKAHATRHRLTLGEAVSDLVRRASERPLITEQKNGLAVVHLTESSPRVTSAHVAEVAGEWP